MKKLFRQLEREQDTHKGQNGKVGVIAGSRDYTGAPALAAKAALRTGCDLVKILTSRQVSDTVASYSENFIVEDYQADYFDIDALNQALELAEWADVVVIGPGMGEPRAKAVREFIQEAKSTLVVDADALEYVGRSPISDSVLTPHGGEFDQHVERIMDELLRADNIVLEKGATDTIYTEEGEKEIEAGSPAMTVGGTGDVLTGVIASLISQGLEKDEAAELGAWINGKAGEKAAEEYENGLMATDVIEEISEVLKK
jgi:hydroxyethylthiazole kinase-like uncharacterized protein yjeF